MVDHQNASPGPHAGRSATLTTAPASFIADTLRYCDAHCDDDAETALVAWVAEKFAEGIAATYPGFSAPAFLADCSCAAVPRAS